MQPRMKTSYFAAAAAGLVILAGPAFAQKPEPHAPAAPPAASPAGPQGVALLLDTLRVVEGTFTLDARGNYVRVGGVAQVVPAGSVLFVGTSRDDVAKYLAGRANAPTPAAKPSPGDFNGVAAKAFPTTIQPVLTNLCATCHAKPDYAGTFQLKPIPTGYADPEAARANTVTAFTHLDRADPSASELLSKAVTAHGGQKTPALRDRSHAAYRVLELWAHGMTSPEGTSIPQAVPKPKPTLPPAVLVSKPPAATVKPAPPVPSDPFDPRAFNANRAK